MRQRRTGRAWFPAGGGAEWNTAIYSGGESEAVLGEVLKGRREEVLISTKATFRSGSGPNDVGSSRQHLAAAVEGRLQTDRIDIFQSHAFDAATPLEETLGTLDGLVRAGTLRSIGCSNFPAGS
jgi:aryl-alcohol dehydrogenase-like predicted oxidoreductase